MLQKSTATTARIGAVTGAAHIATNSTATDDDRRFARRKARSLPAYLCTPRLPASVPCVVRDLSSTGAKVEIVLGRDTVINSADALPDTVLLHLVADDAEVDCRIAWRKGRFVGVRFIGITRPRPRKPSRLPARKR